MVSTKVALVTMFLVTQTLGQMFVMSPPQQQPEHHRKEAMRRNYQRPRVEIQEPVRGQSFGLEKFLTQPFSYEEEEETQTQATRRTNTNRGAVRPKKNKERGKTYGLENITPQVYNFEQIIKDSAEVNIAQEQNMEMKRTSKVSDRRPVLFDNEVYTQKPSIRRNKQEEKPREEPLPTVILPEEFHIFPTIPIEEVPAPTLRPTRRINKENIGNHNEFKPMTFAPLTEPVQQTTTTERTTARPRKRIALRRRKVRPQANDEEEEQVIEPSHAPEQQEEQITENEGLKLKRKRPMGFRKQEQVIPTTTEKIVLPTSEIQIESTILPIPLENYPPVLIKENNEVQSSSNEEDLVAEDKEESAKIEVVDSKPKQPSAHQLKTLLKQQSGTLSLSEILQTQNLSLTDFLRGNKGAISALGGKKVDPVVVETTTENIREKLRPKIPKLSPKSRPFSKSNPDLDRSENYPKIDESDNYPKKLDVVEVTTERTSYNGFQPKNPRIKSKFDIKPPKPEEKIVENIIKQRENERKDELPATEPHREPETTTQIRKDRLRLMANRLMPSTTSTTTSKPREVPTTEVNKSATKRLGELRPKLRIDRRKHLSSTTTAEPVTEVQTTSDNNEVLFVTTSKPIDTQEKAIVRIPFMSSNNPDLPLIVPQRNRTRYYQGNRDRLGPLRGRPFEKEEKPEIVTENVEHILSRMKYKNMNKLKETAPPLLPTISSETTISNSEKFDSKKESQYLDDIKIYDSKDEIAELLKSGSSAQRLARILASRNMTLDELLENREKGTAQIDFEKLFEEEETVTKAKETTPQVTTTIETKTTQINRTVKKKGKVANAVLFPNFPDFENNNIKISKDSNEFDELLGEESYPASVQIQATRQETKDSRMFPFPLYNEGLLSNNRPTPPVWNSYPFPYNYQTYEERYPNRGLTKTRTQTQDTETYDNYLGPDNDIVSFGTANKTEAANKNLKHSIDEILREQTKVHESKDDYEKTLIPPAVKSAIIASGVVLGIALFVFIAIFVACGCRQRQIRLRGKSSILNDTLSRSNSELKAAKKNNTLSPISFQRSGMYRKALDFETASSISNSSNASSYLWNTLKNTFTSRNNTLKNMKNEEMIRQESEKRRDEERRNTLKNKEKSKSEEQGERRRSERQDEDRGGVFSKIDPERNVINTSLTFKRGGINASTARFNTCSHLNS